ncbi:MAG: hypothetical protein ACRC5M_01315 [Anaeroplasmataceae bacterium]
MKLEIISTKYLGKDKDIQLTIKQHPQNKERIYVLRDNLGYEFVLSNEEASSFAHEFEQSELRICPLFMMEG